jgi:hypothetical protein
MCAPVCTSNVFVRLTLSGGRFAQGQRLQLLQPPLPNKRPLQPRGAPAPQTQPPNANS